jgi:predicted permease
MFLALIVAAASGGYVARRRGWGSPDWARPLMSWAIIGCDAPIALLAIWHLEIDADIWKVPVSGLLVGITVTLLGLTVARSRRLAPTEAGVFGLQAGMGNVGYTLGGLLCFGLWGMQGLAVEQMFCMMWPFFAFLYCFPVGRHYGDRAAGVNEKIPLTAYALRALGRSLADLRSLPLYCATAGLVLNLSTIVPPASIKSSHVIDVLMIVGICMQFGGIGMTLRASRIRTYWRFAAASGLMKFIVSPALMLGVAWAMGLRDMPLAVCVLLAAMPTAVYSVLIANVFGLNRDLANTTFILTHIVCLSVIAALMAVSHATGWTVTLPGQ